MPQNLSSNKIIRVAVTGPESTGKSWLCENLAAHYQTLWIPEYSRVFLSELDREYTINDIVQIYTQQFQLEQDSLKQAKDLIFIDTEFIIAKVWCEHVFKSTPEYIGEMIKNKPYDLYLLTSPDLPWEYDPLRENPGKGDFFFNWYKEILETNNFQFGTVAGTGQARLNSAITIIDNFLVSRK